MNEINNDCTIKSKSGEIANYALDCSDMFFSKIIIDASRYISKELITKIIMDADKIDCLHHDYVYPY